MDDKRNAMSFEEVHDTEVDDIWDIFFPNVRKEKSSPRKTELKEQTKPRRYLRFLTMSF